MVFFETSLFTKAIKALLSDDDYKDLQQALIGNPEAGVGIAGRLRKLRWSVDGKGKRSGIRVIYYYIDDADQVYMLLAYKKAKKENLTKEQEAVLIALVKEELGNG